MGLVVDLQLINDMSWQTGEGTNNKIPIKDSNDDMIL